MSTELTVARPADFNPFSVRCVRPGEVDYQFAAGVSVERLLERLRRNRWRGQVTGPHGSGKSTLLCALEPALRRAGRDVVAHQLRQGERGFSRFRMWRDWTSNTQVVIDGYEQLGRFSRFRLRWACRRQRAGLLATAHHSVGLPTLHQTTTDLDTARRIVRRLLSDEDATIGDEDIARCFVQQAGNMRETLFSLYDVYQQRCLQVLHVR